jgi:hypothetical protein
MNACVEKKISTKATLAFHEHEFSQDLWIALIRRSMYHVEVSRAVGPENFQDHRHSEIKI